MANLLLMYHITTDKKLNIFNLSQIKDFLVLFVFYTFLNSYPFHGIVWVSGTISNNFGFLFLCLFVLYVKKLVLNKQLKIKLLKKELKCKREVQQLLHKMIKCNSFRRR